MLKYMVVGLLAAGLWSGVALAQSGAVTREAMLERARQSALPGSWVPAPTTKLSNAAANYAQRLCSAVFIADMDLALAKATMGDDNALVPLADRVQLGEPVIDAKRREVRVGLPGGGRRVARLIASQGCVMLPQGDERVGFAPSTVVSRLDPAARWPMGDSLPKDLPSGVDRAKLAAALAAAFEPDDAFTQAFVVTWRGQLIGERYGLGANARTPIEGWSMGKSIVATLLATLIQRGVYTLDQSAPLPEWQSPGDPRQAIRIRDIMQMSSGLRIRAEQDPEYVDDGRLADHWYYYGAPNAFAYAASRQLEWKPGTIGRYRNTDPVLGSYLVKLGVDKLGEDYRSYPQRALFDRLGIRSAVLETDASGNFITQGSELLSARDWARLGNLYLQDGMWNGERVLPEGFVRFVSTPAPAWVADGRPIYGGFFWLNTDGALTVPKDAFYMLGAGGQWTVIVPSHDLVISRLGRYAGRRPAATSLNKALALLLEAVPPAR